MAGGDRIDTARLASARFFAESPDALVATGFNYPDALAAGGLAASLGAPLLLISPTDVPATVRDELARLGASRVWLMGGPAAISVEVEESLAEQFDVRRVAGGDRYATAAAVADRLGVDGARDGIVTLGTHANPSSAWPDALSAGAFAAVTPARPLLLTAPSGVPTATLNALQAMADDAHVSVLGGPVAIPESTLAQVAGTGVVATRVAGGDRYATSVAAATRALDLLSTAPRPLVVASGANYPDGLAGAALAARLDGILLLVPPSTLDHAAAVKEFLAGHRGRISDVVVMGGTVAVSDTVFGQLADALGLTASDTPPAAPSREPGDDDGFTTHALSTTSMLTVDDYTLDNLDHLACDAAPDTRATPSVEAAVASLWKLVEANESPKAMAGFRASDVATDLDAAVQGTVAAIAANRPGAAMAAALTAVELAPNDPHHLVNAAGIALGLRPQAPLEALALLEAAGDGPFDDPMNVSGESVALTNRGVALAYLRRFDQAAAAFQQAAELDGDMRDALKLKASVEVCRDRPDEAIRLARAGVRRMVDRAEHPTRTLGQPPRDRAPLEAIDIAQGTTITFPPLFDLPGTPRDAHRRSPQLTAWSDQLKAELQRKQAEIDRLEAATDTAMDARGLPTRIRHNGLSLFAYSVDDAGSELASYAAAVSEAHALPDPRSDVWESSGAALDCSEQDKWEQVLHRVRERHAAQSAWVEHVYPAMTGVLAHMSVPEAHQAAVARLQHDVLRSYEGLVTEVAFRSQWIWEPAPGCLPAKGPADEPPLDEPDGDRGEACPPALQGNKFEVDLIVASIAANCTEIDLEVSAGWLGPFVKGSWNTRTGDVTVFIGVKAETPTGTNKATLREGAFVTMDGNGQVKDAGMRIAVEGNIGNGPVSYSADIAQMSFSVQAGFTSIGL